MEFYLLDTNPASALWDAGHPHHNDAIDFVKNAGGEDFIFVPRVVIAEIKYGAKVVFAKDRARQQAVEQQIKSYESRVKDINKHTIEPYSDIRAALFRKFGTKEARNKIREKWPEDLVDQTTAKSFGIQENDLWIAAIAVEYNMVLITDDKMTRIQEAAKEVNLTLRLTKWSSKTP